MSRKCPSGSSKTLPNSKFFRPGCGLMCGHSFPHHRAGVILKGLEPSPPWRLPSDVKPMRFRPQYYFYLVSKKIYTKVVPFKTFKTIAKKRLQGLLFNSVSS